MTRRQGFAVLVGLIIWYLLYTLSQGATNRTFIFPNNPPFYVLVFGISTVMVYFADKKKVVVPMVGTGILWGVMSLLALLGYGYLFGMSLLVFLVGFPLSLGLAWAAGYIMEHMPIF